MSGSFEADLLIEKHMRLSSAKDSKTSDSTTASKEEDSKLDYWNISATEISQSPPAYLLVI